MFDELTPAQQKIIEIASAESHQWTLAKFMAENGAALQRLQAGGVTVLEFPDSVWEAMGVASKETMDQYRGDDLYDRIIDSASTSMRSSAGWIERSEGVYRNQRDRILGL